MAKSSGMDARLRDAKRVGIWIRVSTEDQVKGESPEHQMRWGQVLHSSIAIVGNNYLIAPADTPALRQRERS